MWALLWGGDVVALTALIGGGDRRNLTAVVGCFKSGTHVRFWVPNMWIDCEDCICICYFDFAMLV